MKFLSLIFILISCATAPEDNSIHRQKDESYFEYVDRQQDIAQENAHLDKVHGVDRVSRAPQCKNFIGGNDLGICADKVEEVLISLQLNCKDPMESNQLSERKFFWQSKYKYGWIKTNPVGTLDGRVKIHARRSDHIVKFTSNKLSFLVDVSGPYGEAQMYEGILEKEIFLDCQKSLSP